MEGFLKKKKKKIASRIKRPKGAKEREISLEEFITNSESPSKILHPTLESRANSRARTAA